MKVTKKLLCLLLAISIMSSLLVSCKKEDGDSASKTDDGKGVSEEKKQDDDKEKEKEDSKGNIPDYLNAEGFPIVKEPITIKAFIGKHPSQPEHQEIEMWQEYEKMTGIKMEWENVPSDSLAEKRNLALNAGEYPDIFIKCGMSDNDLTKYGSQGIFIPLNDYLDDYAPNFKKLIDSMEDIRKSLPDVDGKIYGFPQLSDAPAIEISPKLFVNRKWLDKVGKDMPTTTDEYYDVLRTFKENDPNGNGAKDEIPLSTTSLGVITNGFVGAWGLRNRGRTHEWVDWDEEANELRFIPTSDGFKEQLEYMNKLYEEGLMDEEIFTMDTTQLVAKGDQDLVGSFFFVNTQVIGGVNEQDFEGLEVALKGPNGDQIWSAKRGRLSGKAGLVITDKCEHPEAVIRWVDYFYSDEGTRMFYMGTEGKTYEKTADGKYEFLPEVVEIPEGSNFDQVISKHVPYLQGPSPTITLIDYFQGGEAHPISLKAAENIDKFTPKEIWGKFNYTLEEIEEKASLESDIFGYINEMIPQFVEGRVSFSEWDNYVNQIKTMDLDRYMEIYKAGYDRYMAN